MQCGQTYYLGADVFLPGGGTTEYVTEEIPYNPPFAFNSGTSYASYLCNQDDAWGQVFSLNYGNPSSPDYPDFTFDFYGETYAFAIIGANGLISFDWQNPTITNNGQGCANCSYTQERLGAVPNTSRFKNCIMAPYYDINFGIGGEIYFQIIGEYPCRKLVLSYYQVPMFSCTSEIATHMCVIYETSNVIEFYLQNKPICTGWVEGLATLGIQNKTGTQATTIPGYSNSVWEAQNEAWRIKPVGELEYIYSWYKVGADGVRVDVTPDLDGRVMVDATAESGPVRYYVEAEVYRNDGYTFTVIDSSAVYYPIDMPDIAITHPDTVCRGANVNFEVTGGGDNGRYYIVEPYATPDDTLQNNGTGQFVKINDAAADSVVYTFKIENYDQYGTLVCTRYETATVHNRSFNVKLRDDITICKGDSVQLTDVLNEHEGVSTWSWQNATGETIMCIPEEIGNLTVTLTKTDNLGCQATDDVVITVNDSPEVTINGTMAICEGTSTTLRANTNPTGCEFLWSNGSTESSITVSPAATEEYTVSVKLPPAMCETIKSATVTVSYAPEITVSNDETICEGESAEISATTNAHRVIWETTDPVVNGSNGTAFTVNPKQTTLYTINAYSDINCHSKDEIKIIVEQKPTPAIVVNPGVLDALDPTIIITDASTGNTSRQWRLGDGTETTDESFVHTFPLTDTTLSYNISLIASSNAGCVDSTSTIIRVKRDHYLWAPTGIYLHDNNPANREFRLWIDNIVEYELMIFNRFGEMLFKTNDIEEAWDCTFNGKPVIQGVYVWKAVWRHNDAPNKEESQSGNFMIYN